MRFSSVVPVPPHVRSGKLRALGISSEKRYGALPGMPTVAEGGAARFRRRIVLCRARNGAHAACDRRQAQ